MNRLSYSWLNGNNKFRGNKRDDLRLFCFVEERLKDEGLISEENSYFIGRLPFGIEDDHTPFLRKGW